MTTPIYARPTDKTYLGNGHADYMQVHYLKNEDTSVYTCQIDEIIEAGNAVVFDPDTLEQAHQDGYDNCAYCIGGSTE